jgi:hypothetical protein
MRIGNYIIAGNLRAKRGFFDGRIFHRPYFSHLSWWKVSLIWGQPHLEPVTLCAECDSTEELQYVRAGEDESLCYCEACRSVEGRTREVTMEEWEAMQ